MVNKSAKLFNADCLEQLKKLKPDSVASLVTDPPAGISFMGKAWDHHKGGRNEWIEWMASVMRECHRVMKPGAHGLVWAIPRTSHWTATALEDAGFEVRDVVTHLFGSGFPKSLDVSKQIDKAAGVKRPSTPLVRCDGKTQHNKEGGGWKQSSEKYIHHPVFDGSTDSAKQWQGWGTALKPASEHWILVRKPCSEKTVAANVQKHGTGALNIDASRIGVSENDPNHRKPSVNWQNADTPASTNFGSGGRPIENLNTQGRFPANLVFSHSPHCTDLQCDIECAIARLDEQSGVLKSGSGQKNTRNSGGSTYSAPAGANTKEFYSSEGGASRFFYCAKISTSERGDGNTHPTVKPKKLMSYLIRMITPPGGTVLDPFMGSGSTGIAAKECGFKFVGIEKEAEYFEIAQKRIEGCLIA